MNKLIYLLLFFSLSAFATKYVTDFAIEDGKLQLKERSASPDVLSSYGFIYPKSSDKRLYFMDSTGAEYDMLMGALTGLDQLNDVVLTAPTNKQILKYNGVNWVNSDASGGVGPWITATAYVLNDTVQINSKIYLCISAHTSGIFSDDYLISAYWSELSPAPNVTASRALVSNASGDIAASSVTAIELGYISGLTSSAQTQISDKFSLSTNFLNDIQDVDTTGLLAGDRLTWNGVSWIASPSNATAGAAAAYYLDDTNTFVDNGTLSITPSEGAEHIITKSTDFDVNGGIEFLERYISPVLSRTSINGGIWEFHNWAESSLTSGDNQIDVRVNRRVIVCGGSGSGSWSGAGPTVYTFTVTSCPSGIGSGSGPFSTLAVTGSRLTSDLVETGTGTGSATAQTGWVNSVIDATHATFTPTDGAIPSGVISLNALYYYMFGVNTFTSVGDLTTTPTDYVIRTSQPTFSSLNTSDRIVAAYFSQTTSTVARNISLYHGGTTRYSHIITPISTLHDDLQGLNLDGYMHLTQSEYTRVGTGASGAFLLRDGTQASTGTQTFDQGVIIGTGASGSITFTNTIPIIKTNSTTQDITIVADTSATTAKPKIVLSGITDNLYLYAGSGTPGSINFRTNAANTSGINATGQFTQSDFSASKLVVTNAGSGLSTSYLGLPAIDGASGTTIMTNGSGSTTWGYPTAVPTYSGSDKTGSYTVLDNDGYALINFTGSGSGSGTMNLVLPTLADNQNRRLLIKNSTTGKGNILVDGEGAETIDGMATVSLDFKSSYIEVQATATEWKIVATNLTSMQKTYTEAAGNFTVTSDGTGWTTFDSAIIPFRDIVGNWWANVSFHGNHSVVTSGPTFTISGITWKDSTSAGPWGGACGVFAGSSVVYSSSVQDNTGTIACSVSVTVTRYNFFGVIPLNSKPTWVE